jgi:Emfourin
MIIHFESEGGFGYFPGLRRPLRIDTTQLAPDEAKDLEGLVERARFFDQPADAGAPPPGAADHRSYTISVEDGDRTHTVRTNDTVQNPDLQPLIDSLRARHRASA